MFKSNSKFHLLLILLAFAVMSSCSMKVKSAISNNSFAPLSEEAEVLVLTEFQSLPAVYDQIGEIHVKDKGMSTNCNYQNALGLAKEAAREEGANILHLIEVDQPYFGSICYEIKANLYHSSEPDKLEELREIVNQSNASTLSKEADYAYVHFYRTRKFAGSGIGFKIRDANGEIIGRARNGETFSYKITQPGLTKFQAKTEKTSEVLIDIEMGKEYYVNCSLKFGALIARPDLYEVDANKGRQQFDDLVSR